MPPGNSLLDTSRRSSIHAESFVRCSWLVRPSSVWRGTLLDMGCRRSHLPDWTLRSGHMHGPLPVTALTGIGLVETAGRRSFISACFIAHVK